MTLSLVTLPSSIQQYPSGLIALRCADFMGPARGTLSSVADGDSLAGNVVLEEQAIAVATSVVSFSTRFAAAADTLRVPWSTLTALFPGGTFGAYFMVSVKATGDTPAGGDASGATHLRWATNSLGPALTFGRDTTLLNNTSIWRSVWGDQFLISDPQFISTSSMTGTNMVLRLWGITGGTLQFALDALYVIPRISDFGVSSFPSDFPVFSFDSDGAMFIDEDTDPSGVPIGGDHSTTWMEQNPIANIFTLADIQEANDEPTYLDINGNGLWDGSTDPPGADPPSLLALMAAPIYLPAQSLISDPFSNSHLSDDSTNPVVSTPAKFTKTLFVGNYGGAPIEKGWSEVSGFARARIPAGVVAGVGFYPQCLMVFGNGPVITGETNTPDHQHPLLTQLEDCVQTFSFDIDTVAEVKLGCGQGGGATITTYNTHALLELDGAGALTLSLVSQASQMGAASSDPSTDTRQVIDGPVTITGSYSAGTTYWAKVERRRYHWRAKCWADGDPEPGWQVEGFAYMLARNSTSSVFSWIAHPYDTNWVGDVNHDFVMNDPTDDRGCPFFIAETGNSQPQVDIRVFQYDLELDPAGSPVDMHIQEEKYDGSAQWDSVTVPYATVPSWRMVEGTARQRHFGLDTHGFNLRLWKDAGTIQYAAVPILWERAQVSAAGIISLSHLRAGDRYGDRVTLRA